MDNYIHGNRSAGGGILTGNLYPSSYPTNPRIALYGQTGTSPLVFIVNISGYTYVAGDYLRIEITGAIYETSNSNTNWYIKLKSLSALAETFIADSGISKITDTPSITYLSDPNCRYEVSYNTTDDIDTVPARTTVGVPDLYKYLWFWMGQYSNPSPSYMQNPVKLGMNWKSFGSNFGLYSNAGFGTWSNLEAGQSITMQKSGNDYIFTFTDVNDYNKMKSDLTAMKAHSSYTTWLGLPDTDSRYYGYFIMYFKVAENVGDNTGATYNLYLWFGDSVVYDDGNMKVTWTCQIPTNNLTDPGDCNNVDTTVASVLSIMTSTKNLANMTVHSHVESVGWHYASWPYYFEDKLSYKEFAYYFLIDDCFVNGLVDMESLGFLYGILSMNGVFYSHMWVMPRYLDKVTFTDPTDHASRLANWKLERRILLRTDNPADTAYEIVHEEP